MVEKGITQITSDIDAETGDTLITLIYGNNDESQTVRINKGDKGETGEQGIAGVGIADLVLTRVEGLTNYYHLVLTDGNYLEFCLVNEAVDGVTGVVESGNHNAVSSNAVYSYIENLNNTYIDTIFDYIGGE